MRGTILGELGCGRFLYREIVDGHGEELVPGIAVMAQSGSVDVQDLESFEDPHRMAVSLEHAATIGLRVRPSGLDQLHLRHQNPWSTMGCSRSGTAEFAINRDSRITLTSPPNR